MMEGYRTFGITESKESYNSCSKCRNHTSYQFANPIYSPSKASHMGDYSGKSSTSYDVEAKSKI